MEDDKEVTDREEEKEEEEVEEEERWVEGEEAGRQKGEGIDGGGHGEPTATIFRRRKLLTKTNNN